MVAIEPVEGTMGSFEAELPANDEVIESEISDNTEYLMGRSVVVVGG